MASRGLPNHKSLGAMARELKKIHDDEAAGWSSEVDTLLVFAALFSAVVTGLMVDQLKSLQEDPAETTAAILKNLVARDSSQPPPFHPDPTDVAINTLWSLSLIMSLSSALFGLLCKQWIQEHLREIEPRTHAESVALLWVRKESLSKWHVPSILAALPPLLQISVILFFAGLLLLLHARHLVPFIVSMVAIGLTVSFYLITVVLPSKTLLQSAMSIVKNNPNASILQQLPSIQFVCPYKSPQAFIIFSFTRFLLRTAPVKHLLYRLFSGRHGFGTFQDELDENTGRLSDWASLDLYIIRTYDNMSNAPPIYELQGFRWLLKTFRETASMAKHVQNVLNDLPSPLVSIVAKSSLDQWNLPTWRSLTPDNLKAASRTPPPYFSSERQDVGLDPHKGDIHPPVHSPLYTRLLLYQYTWDLPGDKDWDTLYQLTERLYDISTPKLAGIPFVVPFPEIEKLLIATPTPLNRPGVPVPTREQQTGLRFLQFYKEGWTIASMMVDSGHYDQLALVKALVKHLGGDCIERSAFVTSPVGYEFIKFVHDGIIDGRLYDNGHWKFVDIIPIWKEEVVERVKGSRMTRGLPVGDEDFKEIPAGAGG